MLKQAGDFTKETLQRLVIFCTRDSVCPEMRSEVLKVAARGIAYGYGMNLKFTLSLQGWGVPELFAVDGDQFGELTNIEEKIGAQATVVSIQQHKLRTELGMGFHVPDEGIVKQILARGEHQHEGLDELRLTEVMLCGIDTNPENPLLTLMKASKEWWVEFLYIEDNKDIWATLASIANAGGIKVLCCNVGHRWLNDVDLADVRKLWEISQSVVFQVPEDFGSRNVIISLIRGGRSTLGSLEENWHRMVNAAQTIDAEPEPEPEEEEEEPEEEEEEKNKEVKE